LNLLSSIFGGKIGRSAGSSSRTTGLYVDIENLQEDAKSLVSALFESWPETFPKPGLITLYVPADQAELWRMWGITQFKEAQVRVRGIQRFAGHLSKNSADLAIATDAVTDYVRNRVGHVAVFSDDSDFMSLYVKIREESGEGATGETPFLWVLTDRRGTKSLNIRRYFPNEHIFVVRSGGYQQERPSPSRSRSGAYSSPQRSGGGSYAASRAPARAPARSRSEPRPRRSPAPVADPAADRAIAEAIVEKMAVGYFKSTDCQSLVRSMYPEHPLAHASSGVVGQRFVRHILPLLLDLGVTEPNPNRRPRRFQITEESKDKVRGRTGGSREGVGSGYGSESPSSSNSGTGTGSGYGSGSNSNSESDYGSGSGSGSSYSSGSGTGSDSGSGSSYSSGSDSGSGSSYGPDSGSGSSYGPGSGSRFDDR
jgi:hypothetical protein